jgi:beta-carotene/zeaxanthin 4-ketolase
MQHDLKTKPLEGLLVASIIVGFWIYSLEFLLFIDIAQLNPLLLLPLILGRAFIQTGLFIVAHDAIHGSVIPNNRRLNNWLGRFAVMLYALLSYKKLSLNHWQHHQHSGQPSDPDFYDGVNHNIFVWYLKFMKEYLDTKQTFVLLFGIVIIFLTLYSLFAVSVVNLILFWLLPIVISSIQLFFFGTYLPHKSGNPENAHHATSSNYPLIWSFLTCYHFGYHLEHHEYPFLPWYRLPSVHQSK